MISDRVQKAAWLAASVGVVALALAVSLDKPWVAARPNRDAGASLDAAADVSVATVVDASEPVIELDASVGPAPTLDLGALAQSDASTRSVKVGVVLVQFAGAQFAQPTARPKAAAIELSRKLAEEARADFHAAVTHGDPGSADDIGRIARGVLEPQVEAVVFSMAPGQTSDPIETPRGYWVVKRIE